MEGTESRKASAGLRKRDHKRFFCLTKGCELTCSSRDSGALADKLFIKSFLKSAPQPRQNDFQLGSAMGTTRAFDDFSHDTSPLLRAASHHAPGVGRSLHADEQRLARSDSGLPLKPQSSLIGLHPLEKTKQTFQVAQHERGSEEALIFQTQ